MFSAFVGIKGCNGALVVETSNPVMVADDTISTEDLLSRHSFAEIIYSQNI